MSLLQSPAPVPSGRLRRAEQRRVQVVQAARECFLRDGFHGASMAQIAAQAGMSVGQIYRFFPGKEAIIEAIVEEGVAQKLDHIAAIERAAASSGKDLAAVSAHVRPDRGDRDEREEAALTVEILAEASRNPAVARIVCNSDRRLRERAEQMVATARPEWPSDRVSDTVRVITALHEGWWLRVICHPEACESRIEPLRAELIARALEP